MKLAGFTLLEMLIGMMMVSLLLAMGIKVYGIFVSVQRSYDQQVQLTYERVQLQDRLWKDIRAADRIYPLGEGEILLLDRWGKEQAQWQLGERSLIRKLAMSIDTFQYVGRWQYTDTELVLQEANLGLSYRFQTTPRTLKNLSK
ncbi:MAG: prepilin-type N-terminal cleavage/methylation domain-containing protein [Bacteroidota bacterium]